MADSRWKYEVFTRFPCKTFFKSFSPHWQFTISKGYDCWDLQAYEQWRRNWNCDDVLLYTDGSYRENNENLLFLMTMTTWERISKGKKEIQASLTAWSLKSDFIPAWRISFSNRTPVLLNTNLSTKRGAYKMRTVPPTARQHLLIAR